MLPSAACKQHLLDQAAIALSLNRVIRADAPHKPWTAWNTPSGLMKY